ncbi:hypothetical protein IHE44_0011516, partial [Lamprotornis superbus]
AVVASLGQREPGCGAGGKRRCPSRPGGGRAGPGRAALGGGGRCGVAAGRGRRDAGPPAGQTPAETGRSPAALLPSPRAYDLPRPLRKLLTFLKKTRLDLTWGRKKLLLAGSGLDAPTAKNVDFESSGKKQRGEESDTAKEQYMEKENNSVLKLSVCY